MITVRFRSVVRELAEGASVHWIRQLFAVSATEQAVVNGVPFTETYETFYIPKGNDVVEFIKPIDDSQQKRSNKAMITVLHGSMKDSLAPTGKTVHWIRQFFAVSATQQAVVNGVPSDDAYVPNDNDVIEFIKPVGNQQQALEQAAQYAERLQPAIGKPMTEEQYRERLLSLIESAIVSGIEPDTVCDIAGSLFGKEIHSAAQEREYCAWIAENLQSEPGVELLKILTTDHQEAGEAIAAAIRKTGGRASQASSPPPPAAAMTIRINSLADDSEQTLARFVSALAKEHQRFVVAEDGNDYVVTLLDS